MAYSPSGSPVASASDGNPGISLPPRLGLLEIEEEYGSS